MTGKPFLLQSAQQSASTTTVLAVADLSFTYASKAEPALQGINFTMQKGEIFGFLYGAIISALLWIALLKPLPVPNLVLFLPPAILFDLGIVGFYFIAILVLYDKGQATLYAPVVSPLRFWEYITSKLMTLTLLAIVLCLALVFFTYGLAFNLWLFILGTALMSLISLLVGFIAAAPFRSVTSYMMPSGIYVTWLSLLMVSHFGWWDHPLFYLSPTPGSL